MSIERVVTVLTPVFAAVAGLVTSSIGQLVPGVNLNKTDVTALFVAGAVVAGSAALKWLHGRQKFVQFTTDADKLADNVVAKVKANQIAGPALSDIESVLKAHTDQIIETVVKAVHAPPTVDEVVEQIAQKIVGPGAPAPASPAIQ